MLVEVADTGTGIAPDIIDKIFEPFFTTKEIGKGTGLGLSTVYGIIKQTGGFIYPESEPGSGTTFRIFLPRHIPAPTRRPERAADAPAIAGARAAADEVVQAGAADLTGQGTILLVEDEEGLRALNARGLSSRGYTVLEAGNGVEALEVLERNGGKVDLVVSDVVMPEMDGPTLLKEMRKRNPDLKIIFVSGYAEDAFEKNLPEGEPVRLPGEAVHAQAAGRGREGDDGGGVRDSTRRADLDPHGVGAATQVGFTRLARFKTDLG